MYRLPFVGLVSGVEIKLCEADQSIFSLKTPAYLCFYLLFRLLILSFAHCILYSILFPLSLLFGCLNFNFFKYGAGCMDYDV
jgi:hypothetical protein